MQELSKASPVFAAGPDFFHTLGGVEALVENPEAMRPTIIDRIRTIREAKADGRDDTLGPWGRGALGGERGGRTVRPEIIALMNEEFAAVAANYEPKR